MELIGGLLLGCVVSGVVPLVNAELLVAAAAAAVPPEALPLVVVAATVGQMASKTALFGLARWAPSRLPVRARQRLDRAVAGIRGRSGALGGVVFASAAVGLPPFYGVSLAGGALRMSTSAFVMAGTAGRAIRFAVLAWAAHAAARGLGGAEWLTFLTGEAGR